MYPPPEPDKETVVENPVFVSTCMAKVSADAARVGWRFGNFILTHRDIWGFVFRIDILPDSESQDSEVRQRYICWSGDQDESNPGTAIVYVKNYWSAPEGF
jgi:hypothetical protein